MGIFINWPKSTKGIVNSTKYRELITDAMFGKSNTAPTCKSCGSKNSFYIEIEELGELSYTLTAFCAECDAFYGVVGFTPYIQPKRTTLKHPRK